MWYSRITEICSSSREPKWANTPDLLISVTSARTPMDRPSRPIELGLEGLSIGVLAEVTEMSKSGVFAHFGSREELQISVIREYYARFADEVFSPAMDQERGLPRV